MISINLICCFTAFAQERLQIVDSIKASFEKSKIGQIKILQAQKELRIGHNSNSHKQDTLKMPRHLYKVDSVSHLQDSLIIKSSKDSLSLLVEWRANELHAKSARIYDPHTFDSLRASLMFDTEAKYVEDSPGRLLDEKRSDISRYGQKLNLNLAELADNSFDADSTFSLPSVKKIEGKLPADSQLGIPNDLSSIESDLKSKRLTDPSGNLLGAKFPQNDGKIVDLAEAKKVGDITSVQPLHNVDLDRLNDKIPNEGEDARELASMVNDSSAMVEYASKKGDDIEAELANKANLPDDVDVIAEEKKMIEERKSQIEKIQLKNYKEATLQREQRLMNQQIQKFQPVIDNYTNKLVKHKNRLNTIFRQRGDLPKKRDAIRKLKPYERLVFGVTTQVQDTKSWLVDINPSVRYQITSYWSFGSGWNERMLFGDKKSTSNGIRASGIRSFSEVVIFKGFAARIDIENLGINRKTIAIDEPDQVRTWNYVFGVKKEFTFYKRIVGNVQFMYNVYSTENFSPYSNRFNTRFGFEFISRKSKK